VKNLTKNIKSAGVEDFVCVIDEEVQSTDYKMPDIIKENAPYSMIIIDADGEIFKYMCLFQEYLIPGSIIVIDDYKPIRPFNRESGGKDYRTYLQTNVLVREGVIDRFRIKRHTFFGTLSVDAPDLNIIESEISDLYDHEEKIRRCEF